MSRVNKYWAGNPFEPQICLLFTEEGAENQNWRDICQHCTLKMWGNWTLKMHSELVWHKRWHHLSKGNIQEAGVSEEDIQHSLGAPWLKQLYQDPAYLEGVKNI